MGFVEEIDAKINELQSLLCDLRGEVEKLRGASNPEAYFDLLFSLERKYSRDLTAHYITARNNKPITPDKALPGEKREYIRDKIEHIFGFYNKRIKLLEELNSRKDADIGLSEFRDVVLREICDYLDALSFNWYYPQYARSPGKRIEKFINEFGSVCPFKNRLNIAYLYHLYRCFLTHVGDRPSRGIFEKEPFSVEDVIELLKSCVENLKKTCLTNLIDPAPEPVRQANLVKRQMEALKHLKKRWDKEKKKCDTGTQKAYREELEFWMRPTYYW